VLNHTYTISEELTHTASSSVGLNIPETGYITELILVVDLSITTATSVTPALDGLLKKIDALKITAAGGKVYYDITDGRQGFYREYMRYQGQLLYDKLPGAGTTTAEHVRFIFPIHFGLNPFDPFDKSVVLPAAEVDNLRLEVTWAADSALGTGYTVSSGHIDVTVRELTLEKGETRGMYWPHGINVPLFEAREISLTSTASNLGKTDDVPVGSLLNSALIMVLNSSGDRADDQISEIGVKYPKLGLEELRIDDMYHMKAMNRKHYSIPGTAVNVGVSGWPSDHLLDLAGTILLPFEQVTGKAVGFDLTAAMTGDVNLGFTVDATGGTIHILYYSIALG